MKNKLKNKKIALIGTSPIMLIIANHLVKLNNKITIYSFNKKVGGAWSYYKYKNHYISTQTNVIVPDNKFEERNMPLINEYLTKEFNVTITRNYDKFMPKGYLAKKNYNYNLNPLYEKVLNNKNVKLIKKFIKQISIKNKKVKINNSIFDEIFITTFSGIEKLVNGKSIFQVKPKIILSEHVMVIAKKINRKYLHYSENFDKNFDRAQIRKIDNYQSFTARVRKEQKGKDILRLFLNSKLVKKKSEIIKIVKTKYKHYYRDYEQRDILRKKTKGIPVNYVNTPVFTESFFDLNKKLNILNKKYI